MQQKGPHRNLESSQINAWLVAWVRLMLLTFDFGAFAGSLAIHGPLKKHAQSTSLARVKPVCWPEFLHAHLTLPQIQKFACQAARVCLCVCVCRESKPACRPASSVSQDECVREALKKTVSIERTVVSMPMSGCFRSRTLEETVISVQRLAHVAQGGWSCTAACQLSKNRQIRGNNKDSSPWI